MEIRQERAFVNKIDTRREGGGRVHPRWPVRRVGGVRNHGNLCTLTEGSWNPGERRKKVEGGTRVVARSRGKVFAHRQTTRDLIASLLVFVSPPTRMSKLTRLDRYVY